MPLFGGTKTVPGAAGGKAAPTVASPGGGLKSLSQVPDGFFTATAASRAKFADGFWGADATSRAKMAASFFGAGVAASQAHFQDGFFSADATMRAKFADGFLPTAKIQDGAVTLEKLAATLSKATAATLHLKATDNGTYARFIIATDSSTWTLTANEVQHSTGPLIIAGSEERVWMDQVLGIAMTPAGTNVARPTASAVLDLQGTTGALLLPRLTDGQRNALTAAAGMFIYNTTNNALQFYNGSAWQQVSYSAA